MAVGRRGKDFPGMRQDSPMVRAVESAVSYDFDSLCRGLVTGLNQPYLIRGFRINIPASSIPANALTIQVADSAILHSSAAESGTILSTTADAPDEVLAPSNSRVLGAFQNNATNYVGLAYVREVDPATAEQVAGWDQSLKREVQRVAPTGRILRYQFVITTTGFSTNLPLYIVRVSSAGTVQYIEKAVPGLFRLGSGGAVPNPQNTFAWKNLVNPQTGDRREWVNTDPSVPNPVAVVPGNPANAFDYGDWSITTLKEWMDAIMTRIREVTGSAYWYLDSAVTGNPINLFDVWFDGAGSVLTGAGTISYNYILEAGAKVSGAFQSPINDPSILPGDSYVVGVTSGKRANISTFNGNELVVNSLTGTAFDYGETLYNRRRWAPSLTLFTLTNFADATFRYGEFVRNPFSLGSTKVVTAWSYDTVAQQLPKVTVTSTAHGFQPGDMVYLQNLVSTTNAPNGVQWVREVTANTFSFQATRIPTGAPTVSSATAQLASADRHPFAPRFKYGSWSYSGTTITMTAFDQPTELRAPTSMTGTTLITDTEVSGLSSTANLRPGMRVTGTGIPADTYVRSITSANDVELTKPATASGSPSLTFSDVIVVAGATAASNPPNGRWDVSNITVTGDVQFVVTTPPTGTAGTSATSYLYPDYYEFLVTVTEAAPPVYNVTDVQAIANGPVQFWYPVGPSSLPPAPDASGNIRVDGVVATATVADPVQVQEVSYNAGALDVTTFNPHGLSTIANTTVTIFGDTLVTGYAQTYQNVSVTVTSPTEFTIGFLPSSTPPAAPNLGTYTNGGLDQVFLNYPGNPYPGPVQWSSDMVIKGVIGDKRFVVPQTATATGTPQANRFNAGGVTGTAFLQDGQVMYVVLERNKPVSSGATFVCSSPSTITGTSFLDVAGNPLEPGDFVRFSDEDEAKWVRIGSFTGLTQANLVNDNGQPPNLVQRPLRSGALSYCKGTYDQVIVQPYYLVEASTDVYWLALRRDNGGPISKVYFRNLELEAGEIRDISDNTTTNLLIYTGAGNEGATNPNYTAIDASGPWQYTEDLEVTAAQISTRMVTFAAPPQLGVQKGDKFTRTVGSIVTTYTIKNVISDVTVQVNEDVSGLTSDVRYYRLNYSIQDSDNLTLAIRKEDRELARINTNLSRPVYDESVYVQRINLDVAGSGTVRSGRYIYTGSIANPTGLAWVLHGNASVSETIDNQSVTMPGGHASVGPDACLVHILSGAASFTNGSAINQIDPATGTSVSTGRTVNNPGNPAFPAPTIVGAAGTGVQLVLPPNRRTQQLAGGGGYVVYPEDSYYLASTSDALTGEDLLVIANDTIRQANLDYEEVFGGPKAIIRIVRSLPANTRIRFRTLATYGSVLASVGGGVSLQTAYNNGAVVNELAGVPVVLNAGDAASGGTALRVAGSIEIDGDDGGGNIVGGLRGVADKKFYVGTEANRSTQVWTTLDAVRSHDSYTGSASKKITAAATSTTVSSTQVPGSNITVAANTVVRVTAIVVGRESSDAGQAAMRVEGAFYRAGGSAAAMGSPVTTFIGFVANGSTYNATLALSGNDVVLVVYGDSTSTYWAATIEFQAVGAAA